MGAKCLWLAHCRAWPSASAQTPLRMQLPPKVGCQHSLIVGSSDSKQKSLLKSSQTRAWTSFIEAITATGRVLAPGIIFKGKNLQAQWFLDKFKQLANWYLIISSNGWINNYIGYFWLTDVYDPQTKFIDLSDTRLLIMDGHGSHATNEFMAFCFLNNIYCCYFPAYCSHGMQPLDNGPFNAVNVG
jgi:hypothetical protein